MKVLFLDIDGVLNSSRTALVTPMAGKTFKQIMIDGIDKTAVAMVNRLCKDNNLLIVLSSSHRYDYLLPGTVAVEGGFSRDQVDLFRMGLYLQELGLDYTLVIDATPDITAPNSTRGDEINRWLELNEGLNVENFIILDDVDQFHGVIQFRNELAPHFVKCDGNEGFSFKNFRACEKILGIDNDKVKIILPPK
jgi:hypothetical protein